jgi:hypothetical protein
MYITVGRKTLVGLVAVASAALAGAADATIPNSGGVIHGCYQTKQGTLRVIDTQAGGACSNDETELNWNQTGPPGPPGPKGDPGGVPALLAQENTPQTQLPIGDPYGTPVVLASKQVPAGAYLAIVNLQLMATAGHIQDVSCELTINGAFVTHGSQILPSNFDGTLSSLTLMHSLYTSGGTVSVACENDDPRATSSYANSTQLELLPVGAIQ